MLEKIQNELKAAMKERNKLRISVLRMLISDLKYAQIEKRSSLTDDDFIQVVKRAIKKRKESVELFEKGGRPDLAAKEAEEVRILQQFAPGELDEATVREKIEEVIRELGATDKKDAGRVIKEVLFRHKGRMDGKIVQRIVSERLG